MNVSERGRGLLRTTLSASMPTGTARERLRNILTTTALATGVIVGLTLFQPSATQAQSVWIGTSSDYGTATNWNPNAVATLGVGGVFDNTVAVFTTVDLGGVTFTPNTWTINGNTAFSIQNGTANFTGSGLTNNSSATQTISAILAGAGAGVTQSGTGTLILSGANTYGGATTVNAGILRLGAPAVLPNASAMVVNGGTLDLNNFTQTVGSLSGAGGTITTGGTSGRLNVNQTVNGAYAGSFSGPSDGINSVYLNKAGAGTLTLSGTNTATGNGRILVNAGRLILQNGNAVGDNNVIEAVGGSTVELQANETIGALLSDVTATIQLNANTLTLAGVGVPASGLAQLTITGTGGLTINGADYTQRFTQPLAYTGATTILNGTLQFGGNNIIANGSSVVVNGASAALDVQSYNDTVAGVSLQAGSIIGTTGVLTSLTNVDVRSGSISAILGGTAGLTKTTAGTVTLSGANTYTGATAVNAGILRLGAAGVIPNASALIVNGGTLDLNNLTQTVGPLSGAGGTITTGGAAGQLIVNQTGNGNYAGDFSGPTTLNVAYLRKQGAGTLTLSGTNATTGGGQIFLDDGTLILQNGSAIGDDNILLLNVGTTAELQANETIGALLAQVGSTVALNASTLTLAGSGVAGGAIAYLTITGTGGLIINGASFLQGFTQPLAYTGATTILNGTLQFGGNNIIANGSSVVVNGASAALDVQSYNDTVAGVSLQAGSIIGTTGVLTSLTDVDARSGSVSAILGGAAGLTKTTAGTVTLSGANTYTGATTINAGTLAGGAANAFSAASATTINTGGTLNLGGLAQTSNAVSLAGGTLTNGTLTGAVTSTGGTINAISGTATVTTTAGLTTATGANSYSGATTINGGELRVNGSLGVTAVAVNNTGTLSGIGTIAGAVTVNAGGTLSAGNTPGTLTVGSLALSAGSNTVFELGTPGVAGGATNDHIVVNGIGAAGNLTLGGTLTATAASAGYYRLFDVTGGGTISGSFSSLALTAPSVAGATGTVYSMPAGVPPQVNLAVIGAGQTLQFWDGADQAGNGAVNGGSDTWNGGNTNWAVAPGDVGFNASWLSSVGVFQGTSGTVTVSGTQSFDTLQFNSDGYVLTGGVLGLGVAGGGTINTAAGVTATIGSAITDGIGISLTKVGAGTLALSGANSYSGGTLLNAGTLAVGSAGALGTGTLQMAGGTTLRASAPAFTLANAVVLSSGTATIDTGALDFGLAGVVSGTGTLSKTGAGTLTLSGANIYSGATWIQEGTLRMGGAGILPNQTAVQISAGAIFDLNGIAQTIGSLAGSGAVTLGAATLSSGADNSSTIFSGELSGAGSLTKAGTGVFSLSGINSYTGATSVTGGSLIVNGSIASSSVLTVAAGATVSGSGTLPTTVVNGTLAPGNSPGTLTINGNLTLGAGSLYIAEVQGVVADRINVTGTAALAGTLRIVPLGGAYLFSTPYTLLAAAGGRSGTFGMLDTTGSFGDGVTTAVSYTSNDVQLTLTPKPLAPIVTPSLGVLTPANAAAIASAIDGAVANGGNPSALFGIYNLPASSIPAAVNSLSGEVHTAAPAMAHVASDQFLRTMLDGASAGRLSGTPGGPGGATSFTADLPSKQDGPGRTTFDPARFTLWGATFGSTGRNDGDRAVGSANRNLSDAHVAVGADIRLGSNTVAGVAVAGGQSRASLSGGLGKAEADVFQVGLYGRTTLGTVNLAAALGYARLDTDTTRAIPALGRTGVAASYATQAWSGRIEASLPVATWHGLTLSPLAAFQAVRAASPAAVERDGSGATAGTLTLAGRSDMTSRSELGLQVDAKLLAGVTPVTGFVRVAWAHYYQRDADLTASLNGLPGASFAATGARPDRNTALLAAGADIRLSQSVNLGMRVNSELSANIRRVGGTAKLSVSF